MSRLFAKTPSTARFMGVALCSVWLLTNLGGVAAESVAPTFESANKLYEEGKFADAAASYQKLATAGQTSAALYFNQGNAYFKGGQTGRAVAAYRQAQELAPRDPDVRANLQFARRQVTGPTVVPSRGEQWLARLSLNEWSLSAAAALWITFLLLAAGQWRPALRPALRLWVVVFGAATLCLGVCLGAAFYQKRMNRMAVVVVHDAVIRLGPVAESQEAFTAHDGAELNVQDRKDDWIAVSAGPGRFGWIRRDQVLLSPPA